jgi:MFS family permease
MFGRKNFFLVCIALFTISSLLCGFAWSLQALLLFRVMQGLAGGGMTPVAQSILAAAFPPAKRNQGMALYGAAVVVAPVVGPTLGGWLAERQSLLALVLSNQCAGRHHLQHRHLFRPTKFAREETSTARALGQRSRF